MCNVTHELFRGKDFGIFKDVIFLLIQNIQSSAVNLVLKLLTISVQLYQDFMDTLSKYSNFLT